MFTPGPMVAPVSMKNFYGFSLLSGKYPFEFLVLRSNSTFTKMKFLGLAVWLFYDLRSFELGAPIWRRL